MRELLRRVFHALPPVKRLKRAVEVREASIEGLKRNLSEALRERDSYCGHAMRLDRERNEAIRLLEGAETARGEMQAHAERLNRERDELIRAVEALQAELEASHRQAGALLGQRDALENERDQLKAYLKASAVNSSADPAGPTIAE